MAWQASGADILSIVTSINDIFDSTDQTYKAHIVAMNKHASVFYSEVSKSLQVSLETLMPGIYLYGLGM